MKWIILEVVGCCSATYVVKCVFSRPMSWLGQKMFCNLEHHAKHIPLTVILPLKIPGNRHMCFGFYVFVFLFLSVCLSLLIRGIFLTSTGSIVHLLWVCVYLFNTILSHWSGQNHTNDQVVMDTHLEKLPHDALSVSCFYAHIFLTLLWQVVLLSGHLDSWDVGQGAMDDGGGVIISWEALSLIKDLGNIDYIHRRHM